MGQTWTKKLNSELKLKFVDVRVWVCRNLRQPNTQRVKTDRKVLIQEPVPSLKRGTMLGSTLQTSSIIWSRFLFFNSNRLRKNYTYTFTLKFLAFHLFIIYYYFPCYLQWSTCVWSGMWHFFLFISFYFTCPLHSSLQLTWFRYVKLYFPSRSAFIPVRESLTLLRRPKHTQKQKTEVE